MQDAAQEMQDAAQEMQDAAQEMQSRLPSSHASDWAIYGGRAERAGVGLNEGEKGVRASNLLWEVMKLKIFI